MEKTYTPEQKAMIGKRAAEHGIVANLCIPDHFIPVETKGVIDKFAATQR